MQSMHSSTMRAQTCPMIGLDLSEAVRINDPQTLLTEITITQSEV